MTNNGAVSKSLGFGESYTVPAGYHNGSGKVSAKSPSGSVSITSNGTKDVTNYATASVNVPLSSVLGKNATRVYYSENGSGRSESYTTTSAYQILLVRINTGTLGVSGNYSKRINIAGKSGVATGFLYFSIFFNVSSGTTFTQPTFDASTTNGCLDIISIS